jgi:hypothetical protein
MSGEETLAELVAEQSLLELVHELGEVREFEEAQLYIAISEGLGEEELFIIKELVENESDLAIEERIRSLGEAAYSVPRPYQQHFITEG